MRKCIPPPPFFACGAVLFQAATLARAKGGYGKEEKRQRRLDLTAA